MNKPYKNIKPINFGVVDDFPFIEESFDSPTEYGLISKIGHKVNEIVHFINTILEKKINEYINARFNDIMINSMYDAETETLLLYLDNTESEE